MAVRTYQKDLSTFQRISSYLSTREALTRSFLPNLLYQDNISLYAQTFCILCVGKIQHYTRNNILKSHKKWSKFTKSRCALWNRPFPISSSLLDGACEQQQQQRNLQTQQIRDFTFNLGFLGKLVDVQHVVVLELGELKHLRWTPSQILGPVTCHICVSHCHLEAKINGGSSLSCFLEGEGHISIYQ
ncbi:hypothetical protein PIB30_001699 [Stylosanthes scabra]|uniref:Uncharacterized protein n=1 Tax=Stylosanthes scabra TaxID=79078 RepID=A0ABU6U1I9_9FABA|nr:hypothetical protein [Stylosanthes scabra]